MPFVLAEQASTLLGEASDFFFGESSKGAGTSTATPDTSVPSSVATEERASVAGETSQAASSPGTFPRNETERRVFDRCRDTYLSRGLPLPHDMLFGFVRTNSKEYTAADEVRWGDSALALLDEALQLFHEAKVDRNVQRLLPADEEATRARAIFDECWPYVELGKDCTGHWTVLDRLGRADFDRLHRELGNNQVCLSVYLSISPLPSLSPKLPPTPHPSTCRSLPRPLPGAAVLRAAHGARAAKQAQAGQGHRHGRLLSHHRHRHARPQRGLPKAPRHHSAGQHAETAVLGGGRAVCGVCGEDLPLPPRGASLAVDGPPRLQGPRGGGWDATARPAQTSPASQLPSDQQADLWLLVDVLPRDRLPHLHHQLPLGIPAGFEWRPPTAPTAPPSPRTASPRAQAGGCSPPRSAASAA